MFLKSWGLKFDLIKIMGNTYQTYKLGNLIREVDIRNHDLQCNKLLGLSISKEFIPSIANIIGTDLRSYKVVSHDQFAYVPVTSRNGDKITIAHYNELDDCIVSQAYTVFEVIDKEKLLPNFLMLWFKRPEFDRYARFKSHGSAREVFDWEEMCNTLIELPTIDKQMRIVKQHNAISHRIEANKKTIQSLEAAAQTIYNKTFIVDIDRNRLPDGWINKSVNEISSSTRGVTYSSKDLILDKEEAKSNGVLVLRGNNIKDHHLYFDDNTAYIPKSLVSQSQYVNEGDIVMTMSSGSPEHIGKSFLAGHNTGCVYGAFLNKFTPKPDYKYLLYLHFISPIFKNQVKMNANGTGIDNLNLGMFDSIYLPINEDVLSEFNKAIEPIMRHVALIESENMLLLSNQISLL